MIEMGDVAAAKAEYDARQSRRENPDGSFDRKGRWYPSESERRACCDSVRYPSVAYPYSLMVHCRSAKHVAARHAVKPSQIVTRAVGPNRLGGDYFYKVVARREDGTLVSIFDGETVYRIGVELRQGARLGHRGGYYCYDNAEDARSAVVPDRSVADYLPRVLLRVRASGSYVRYDWGKMAFSRLTPLEIVGDN